MKFSAQEEYGLRCLITISKAHGSKGLTIPEIAKIEGLSQPYVGKLLSVLRKEGFVQSMRGQLGGYVLARGPGEIFIADVLAKLGGKLYDENFCERHTGLEQNCSHTINCLLLPLWSKVQKAVDQAIERLTLSDLIENRIHFVDPSQFTNLDKKNLALTH